MCSRSRSLSRSWARTSRSANPKPQPLPAQTKGPATKAVVGDGWGWAWPLRRCRRWPSGCSALARRTRRALRKPEEWQVRRAEPADAERLSQVQEETWRSAYRHIFPSDFLDSLVIPPSRWHERLTGGVTVQVLIVDDEVAGYCSTALADDPGWGEILAVYVHPGYQRSGFGSILLDAGLDALSGVGLSKALLWVFERNLAARAFYESRDWLLGRSIRLEDIGGIQVTLVKYERTLRDAS